MDTPAMTRPSLHSLLERVRSAEKGSRELDGMVYAVLDGRILERGTFALSDKAAWLARNPDPPHDAYVVWVEGMDWPTPPYSTSLDAVVSLIESELPGAKLGFDPRFFVEGEAVLWDAVLCIPHWERWVPVHSDWIERHEARHAQQPLAALAALLSAKLSMEEDNAEA